jgi:hypothetical protein
VRPRALCRALCQSASLHHVELTYVGLDPERPVLTALESSMVESSCATDFDDSTIPLKRIRRRVDSLLRYLRTSTTLRKIQLSFGAQMVQPRSMDTATLIYNALADNPSLPQMEVVQSPAHPLALFLESTVSLQDLSLELEVFEYMDHEAQNRLAQSLGAIRTLQTLDLDCADAVTMTELVFRHLRSHSTLRSLSLNGSLHSHWYDSFHQLIRTTNTLRDLRLSNFGFAEDDMQAFVNTLRSSRSLTTLELAGCELDVKASRLFSTFVQMQCGNPLPIGGNLVSELRLDGITMGVMTMVEIFASRKSTSPIGCVTWGSQTRHNFNFAVLVSWRSRTIKSYTADNASSVS